MNVSDVMTRPVVSVRSDATVMEAGKLMMQSRISGLPVVDAEDRVVGIVTERDFLRLARPETGGRPRWLELITNSNKVDALTRLREERVDVADRLAQLHDEAVLPQPPERALASRGRARLDVGYQIPACLH